MHIAVLFWNWHAQKKGELQCNSVLKGMPWRVVCFWRICEAWQFFAHQMTHHIHKNTDVCADAVSSPWALRFVITWVYMLQITNHIPIKTVPSDHFLCDTFPSSWKNSTRFSQGESTYRRPEEFLVLQRIQDVLFCHTRGHCAFWLVHDLNVTLGFWLLSQSWKS